LLLSDVSQGLHDGVPFPDAVDVHLDQVVRCSKRLVGAAGRFQPAGISARCHHDSDGPPLKSFLYDDDSNGNAEARFQLCAAQTTRALEHVTTTFSLLKLNYRLAIIVPDADFRRQLAQPLQRQLQAVYPDRFQMLDAAQASGQCISSGVESSPSRTENIVMDEVANLDGTEYLIVICVGLDKQMVSSGDTSEAAFAESRSKLYRGITRAQMLALAVNELVPGGWLEYLTTVRLQESGGASLKPAGMAKEQQERLDAENKRRLEQHAVAQRFLQEKSQSVELGVEEAAFIKQKLIATPNLGRSAHDIEAAFARARTVEWPLQQQLDRIQQLVDELPGLDTRVRDAVQQLAAAKVSSGGVSSAEQAVDSALSSWQEVDTTLLTMIDERGLSVADSERLPLQVRYSKLTVAFAQSSYRLMTYRVRLLWHRR
jgi:hypothetical protein